MRTMFHTCRLVHADLSEYNLLWYKRRLYVIDVSQSVEHDHPRALDFLRMDCKNVTGAGADRMGPRKRHLTHSLTHPPLLPARSPTADYFSRQQVAVLRPRALFEFVCTMDVDEEAAGLYLDRVLATAADAAAPTHEEQVSEEVFMQSFIPRTLDEVEDVEKEHARLLQGEREGSVYHALTGIRVRPLHSLHSLPPIAFEPLTPPVPLRRRSGRTAESACSARRRRRSGPRTRTPAPTAGARAGRGRERAARRSRGMGPSGERARTGNCRSQARR